MVVALLAAGTLLVGAAFVTLVWKVHDRSIHEAVAVLRMHVENWVEGPRRPA